MSDGTDWEFQQGETLVEQFGTMPMPGVGDVDRDDPTGYTVKRRLRDDDEDKQLYYLEWEVETPGGPRVENQLYDAGLVRSHYRPVDTDSEETDDV